MHFLYILFLLAVSGAFAIHRDVDLSKLIAGLFFFVLARQEESHQEVRVSPEPPKVVAYQDKYMEAFLSMEKNEISDERKKQLVHCFVLDHTPVGNVMLRYKADNDAFVYYADHIIPYRFLEAVARKYAITYHCRALVAETKMVRHKEEEGADAEAEGTRETSVENEQEEKQEPQGKEEGGKDDKNLERKEKNGSGEKKSVFAKFKSYNKSSVLRYSGGRGGEDVVIPEKQSPSSQKEEEPSDDLVSNRYTSEGRLADIPLLQAPKREALNKRLKMSFADFKKFHMQTKVPSQIQISSGAAT